MVMEDMKSFGTVTFHSTFNRPLEVPTEAKKTKVKGI